MSQLVSELLTTAATPASPQLSPLPTTLSLHHLMPCLWAPFTSGSPSAVTVPRASSPSTTTFSVAQSLPAFCPHSQPKPQAPQALSQTRRYWKNSTPA